MTPAPRGWSPIVGAPLIALGLTVTGMLCGRWDPFGLAQLGLLAIPAIALLQLAGRRRWPAHDPLVGLGILCSWLAGLALATDPGADGLGSALWFIAGSCLPWITQLACRPPWDGRGILLWRIAMVAVAVLACSAVGELCSGGFQARQTGWWGIGNVNSAMAFTFPAIAAGTVLAVGRGAGRWPRLAVVGAGLVLVAIVALTTGRRSAGLAGVAGLAALAVAWTPGVRWRGWLLPLLAAAILLLPLLVGAGLLPTSGDVTRDLMQRAAWSEWLRSPWLGAGAAGPVVLATGGSEAARIMTATGLWTQHCHTMVLEWLLRAGLLAGVVQLAIWVVAARRIASEGDPWLRRALAVLLATQLAYAALDPAPGELSGLLLSGLLLALCRGAADEAPRDGVGRAALLCSLLAAGALLPWCANRLALAAFITRGAPTATLSRAAEKAVDPVTTGRLLLKLDEESRRQYGSPIFLLESAGQIRRTAGSAGPFLESVRLAASANRSFRAEYTALEELVVRQPFEASYYLRLDQLFRGWPPLSVAERTRRRIAWLSGRQPLPALLPVPGTIEDAADACMIGQLAGLDLSRFANARPVLDGMVARYAVIPVVARWSMACAVRTGALDPAALPPPTAALRWSLGIGGPPDERWARNAAEQGRLAGLHRYW